MTLGAESLADFFFFLVSAGIWKIMFFFLGQLLFSLSHKGKEITFRNYCFKSSSLSVSFLLFHPKMEEVNLYPHRLIIKFS